MTSRTPREAACGAARGLLPTGWTESSDARIGQASLAQWRFILPPPVPLSAKFTWEGGGPGRHCGPRGGPDPKER